MYLALLILSGLVVAEGVVIWQLLNRLLYQASVRTLTLSPATPTHKPVETVSIRRPVMSIPVGG